MVVSYLDWFITFISSGVNWLGNMFIAPGVSLFTFIIAVSLLCIIIGGILIR